MVRVWNVCSRKTDLALLDARLCRCG